MKGNFLAGRSFHDDADLAQQCSQWLRLVNTERPSDATDQPPAVLLAHEQLKFGPLPACAEDYGFFDCVIVSREGLVAIETNRYSVPAHLMGQALTARIHAQRVELFADQERVASHVRFKGQHARIIDPAHFEAAFTSKPRGRIMVYRDWLCSLSPVVLSYVAELSHKRRRELSEQVLALYDLARESGKADFVAALQITSWLDKGLSVIRMLELARADAEHPYQGGETAFYDYVRKVRRARKQAPQNLALRFEGLPGEYLQIDWGEMRDMAFTKEGMSGQTRYFFAARLKYSRYMFVSFQQDMREETLLRCLIACFTVIGGVPWAVVTDNMKTAVLGRDQDHQPIWNPAYQKLAVEFKFHPDVCAPASGNQKGAVENLVLCRQIGNLST